MKNRFHLHLKLAGWLSLALVPGSGGNAFGQSEEAVPLEWPRVIVRDDVTNTIYQPQLESWDYFTFKAISAVAIQPVGARQATFGTIRFTAQTQVDRAEREVLFERLEITSADFPSDDAPAEKYLATLRSLLPTEVRSIALDRLEASLAILEARQKSAGQPLRNEPPVILFRTKPAMLVPVEGQPVYRPVPGTDFERMFNTRALIVRQKSGPFYLHLFDGYVTAPTLAGPWTVVTNVPVALRTAQRLAVDAKQVDLLAGQEHPDTKQKPSLKTTPVPELLITTTPTELIVLQGEPQWAPLPPTQLLYATNTAAQVFKALGDQKNYVLISGRWFRAGTFAGPWEFVPAGQLPKDFAAIPDDSPKENVKASVPDTEQAQEALIANNIPHTIKVDRKNAKLEPVPTYDGNPQLQPIADTPLHYVVNCATPVIKMDGDAWYACQSGVWWVAGAATGPWAVATNVPAAIYSIPPSAPLHYVTYVRIYNFDEDFVWVGTTPGYYGAMVGSDGTVVYGTGYYYPAYVGATTYVAYPISYGYGCNPCWTPWAGWAFGYSVCWSSYDDYYWWCYCPPAPYWGPYWYSCYGAYYNAYGGVTAWGPYGWAGTSGYIYHQNGAWTGVSRGAAGYNAWTGNQWATKYGRAYNSTTGTRVVGQRSAVENVYTGNYAYGGRGAAYNEKTGAAAVGGKVTWGNEATGNQGSAGRATVYNPNTGNTTQIGGVRGEQGGVVNVNGHIIAGKDGNYYRPDGSGGWQQVARPGSGGNVPNARPAAQPQPSARPVTQPQPSTRPVTQPQTAAQPQQWQQSNVTPQQRQSLDNENRARQMGAQRQQSFQNSRPAFQGGGMRGGGGGRRR